MAAWFGKGRHPQEPEPDDAPTGQIPAQVITDADGEGAGERAGLTRVARTAGRRQEAHDDAKRPQGAHDDTPEAPETDNQALEQLRGERATLIQLCLYALDRARSGGVVERLEEGLAGIGVTAMRPDGQRFDPALHEAGGTVATDDAELDGVVAETELVGFADGGKVLRPPIVIVYATGRENP